MLRFLKRILIFLGVILTLLVILSFVLFIFVKHLRIKDIVENGIEESLGIKVDIEKIEFSPFLVHVAAKGVTIHNPIGFEDKELAYLKVIHIVWDPLEMIIKKTPDIYLCGVNIERLNIIKNKNGKVNIKEIIPIDPNDPKSQILDFYFGVFVLSLDEVNYIEYSGTNRKVNKYPVKIKNATFVGLKSEDEVVRLIVYKAIENTNIGKLINLTIIPVVSQLKDTMDAAWGVASGGAKSAWGLATMPFSLFFK